MSPGLWCSWVLSSHRSSTNVPRPLVSTPTLPLPANSRCIRRRHTPSNLSAWGLAVVAVSRRMTWYSGVRKHALIQMKMFCPVCYRCEDTIHRVTTVTSQSLTHFLPSLSTGGPRVCSMQFNFHPLTLVPVQSCPSSAKSTLAASAPRLNRATTLWRQLPSLTHS